MQISLIETDNFIDLATNSTGTTLKAIAKQQIVQSLHNTFGLDWLMTLLGEVDLEKALAKVNKIEQEYPR